MNALATAQALGGGPGQHVARPQPFSHSATAQAGSGLGSQWIGYPIAPRISPGPAVPLGELVRQAGCKPELAVLTRSGNKALLEFLGEWRKEPDPMGPDWWADFDRELSENRLKFRERELP